MIEMMVKKIIRKKSGTFWVLVAAFFLLFYLSYYQSNFDESLMFLLIGTAFTLCSFSPKQKGVIHKVVPLIAVIATVYAKKSIWLGLFGFSLYIAYFLARHFNVEVGEQEEVITTRQWYSFLLLVGGVCLWFTHMWKGF